MAPWPTSQLSKWPDTTTTFKINSISTDIKQSSEIASNNLFRLLGSSNFGHRISRQDRRIVLSLHVQVDENIVAAHVHSVQCLGCFNADGCWWNLRYIILVVLPSGVGRVDWERSDWSYPPKIYGMLQLYCKLLNDVDYKLFQKV